MAERIKKLEKRGKEDHRVVLLPTDVPPVDFRLAGKMRVLDLTVSVR